MNKITLDIISIETVNLHFPQSTYEFYEISLNEALQSEFLKVLIENCGEDFKEENLESSNPNIFFKKKYIDIIIPNELYRGVREVDISKFIELLKGEFFCEDSISNSRFDFKAISKLIQSLIINKDLLFVNLLEKKYGEILS